MLKKLIIFRGELQAEPRRRIRCVLLLSNLCKKRRKIKYITILQGADKSLARPGRKQATATEDSDFHIPYL